MADPKYGEGDLVTFAHPTLITPHIAYAVVRVLPESGLDRAYAIKAAAEPYERVVKERDLALYEADLEAAR